MRLGELDGGHVPLAQAIARIRERRDVGSVIRRGCRRRTRSFWSGGRVGLLRLILAQARRQLEAHGFQILYGHVRRQFPARQNPAHQTRKKYSCSSQARHMGRPGLVTCISNSPDPLFHTLGTRKKWPSVAGAFLTISSGIPPSVTTSGRFFIAIGVTDVIDPRDVDLRQLLDESEDGVELAPKVLDLLLGDRNAGQVRDAADGCGVDGHGASQFAARSRAIAESQFLLQRHLKSCPTPLPAVGRTHSDAPRR